MWKQWQAAVRTCRPRTARSIAISAPTRLQPVCTRDAALSARTVSTSPGPVDAEQSPAEDDQVRARRSLGVLSSRLRSAKSAKHVTTMWAILSRNVPAVFDGPFLRRVGALVESTEESEAKITTVPEDLLAVRMVPMHEMLALVGENKLHLAVGLAGARHVEKESIDHTTIAIPDDRVLQLSENVVARKVIWALYQLGAMRELVEFVETLEADRMLLRAMYSQEMDSTKLTELTTLGKNIDALYITSLGRLGQHQKIFERFRQQGSDLRRYIESRDAVHSLLYACMMEREGDLAKSILDETLDTAGIVTLNVRPFILGFQANLRGAKTLGGLQNALHIYRRMLHEAGYILPPREWSMLFNACVYLDQPEAAIEVFKDYRIHGIAPFQSRFQTAVRTACRQGQYDTAIAMARVCIDTERDQPRLVLSEEHQRAAEVECFNRILWEMFKGKPTRDQVDQVVAMMQERQVRAGAIVLRRIVAHFFATASEELEPQAVVYRFFNLWECSPDVMERTTFVAHLLLNECESRQWVEQCERVIEYALDQNIELPFSSAVNLMDLYASRGHFEDAIHLGELVLHPRAERVKAARTSTNRADQYKFIPDAFFESLLICYSFRERYSDVIAIDEAFELTKRRGLASPKLAAIIRDARNLSF